MRSNYESTNLVFTNFVHQYFLGGHKWHEGVDLLKNNLKNPLAGPIRFELQPQGRELLFLRPPRLSTQSAHKAPRNPQIGFS